MEDFFGDIFPSNSNSKDSRALSLGRMLKKQFQLTDDKGKGFTSLYTIERKSSLISFVTLYGMGKGYSFDEITTPDKSELRKELGKQFIDDLGSMEYSEFIKKNGLENADDEAKKQQYKAYFTTTRDKIEEYYVKGFDAIRKEELYIPDPNDLSDFLKKSQRFCMLGTMITDLKQSWDNLNKKTFASENENDKNSLDKFKAITEYMKQNLLTTGNLADCMDKYRSFFASRDFVEYSGENIGAVVNAAQAKSVLQYFKETSEDIQQKTGKMEYIAQLCDKTTLCSKLEELFAVDNYTDKGIADAAYNHCLCNNDADALTVVIGPETNKILKISDNNKGVISETKELFHEHMEAVENSEKKVKEYIPNLDNLKSDEYNIGMTFSQAYDSFYHPEKQASTEKTAAEKAADVNPIKEQFATMSSITPEQAQFLKETEEHNAKVYEKIDEAVEKLDKEQISFNELLGDKTPKVIMPPEKKSPEKQLEMSK